MNLTYLVARVNSEDGQTFGGFILQKKKWVPVINGTREVCQQKMDEFAQTVLEKNRENKRVKFFEN